ncbi:hypothetical protein [Leptospira levettii]|uniref:hypothetical protein n=1 Tax=Leptospira levettii TaxID=2023178 RepID=UPI0013FE0D43|nr:hypothetical protein [Leptospira levettii]
MEQLGSALIVAIMGVVLLELSIVFIFPVISFLVRKARRIDRNTEILNQINRR